MFPDITPALRARMPDLRGRLSANEKLAPLTWFRVGGPAQVFFQPADEEDLSYFLSLLAPEAPVLVVGLGSNLIVRDGGVPGVVIRLGGKAFNDIVVEDEHRLRVGAAAPDRFVAKRAAELGLDGLAFFSGIPGAIGGALRMNAGAHGGETKDVLIEARGVGILRRPHLGEAVLTCAVTLDFAPAARMPQQEVIRYLGLPLQLIFGRDVPNIDAVLMFVMQNDRRVPE